MKLRFGSMIKFFFVIFFTTSAFSHERKFPPNKDIDPCQNFYQHICSKTIEDFHRPSHRSRYTFYFADASENFLPKVNSFLTHLSSEKNLSPRSQVIRDFYKACTDTPRRIEEEIAVSKSLVREVQEQKSREELLRYAARAVQSGRLNWVTFTNSALLSDPKKWRIEVQINATTMPEKSYYQEQETLKDLSALITNLLKVLKVDAAPERAKRLLHLEGQASLAMPSVEEFKSLWSVGKYWTRDEFVKKYPLLAQQINAAAFPKNVPIHQYTVRMYDFAEAFLAETDLQVLKDYLLVRLTLPVLDFSQTEWSRQHLEFKSKRLGEPAQRRPLEQECSRLAQNGLGGFLAEAMREKFFVNYPKTEFTNLVESLRRSLIVKINENRWLTSGGRKNAARKIKALRMALLYPQKEEDWRFPPVTLLHPERHLENLNRMSQAYDTRTLSEIKGPRNIEAWSISPMEADAYYLWSENRFYFPAAFAMKPIFDADRKKTQNLGGIGTLIAHELGHALDKYGSQYNQAGVKESIFDKKDQQEFEKLSQGFVDHFNQAGHDGEQTLAENLADHVGLATAYHAAFSKKRNLEQQKEFFTSFAELWCTSMSESYRASHLKEDTHALPESRVNEQLKLLPAFAETYKCAPGANMIQPAAKRLKIW